MPPEVMATPLYFLSGPTASGKTELAHQLAARNGWRLLSADAMMVYRGMNVGTAKPTAAEIEAFDYAGVDLVDPDQPFSVGDWLRAVSGQLDERPTLVVGGTGLYFRALLEGLAPAADLPEVDDTRPLSELQAELQALDPAALGQLADPENPRRVARAIAWLRAGQPLPRHWRQGHARHPVPVLRWPTPLLDERIHCRTRQLFAGGLLEEAEGLLNRYSGISKTARQAIGYSEAFEVVGGRMTLEAAVAAVALRTRQYAKRQRTWFRNQLSAVWVDLPWEDAADFLQKVWQERPPFTFIGQHHD